MKLLIANRGEIAVRIARAAAELDIPTVAVYSEDDDQSLHVRRADEAAALKGSGPAAYLDGEQLLRAAAEHECDAVHPGYGFLSENPGFARACRRERGRSRFVGPAPEALEPARRQGAGPRPRAGLQGVPLDRPAVAERGHPGPGPLLPGRPGPRRRGNADQGRVGGGGGRGMRDRDLRSLGTRAGLPPVPLPRHRSRIRQSRSRLSSRSTCSTCGPPRRGPGRRRRAAERGQSTACDRDCSIQRRHQKLVEVAPAPCRPPSLRDAIRDARARRCAAPRRSLPATGARAPSSSWSRPATDKVRNRGSPSSRPTRACRSSTR